MSINLQKGNENLTIDDLKMILFCVKSENLFNYHLILDTLSYLDKNHKTKVEDFAKYIRKAFVFEEIYRDTQMDWQYGVIPDKYLDGYKIEVANKKTFKKLIDFCNQIESYRAEKRKQRNIKDAQKRQAFKQNVNNLINIEKGALKNVKNADVIKNIIFIFNYYNTTNRNVKKAKLLNTLGNVINTYVKLQKTDGKTKITNNIPKTIGYKINQLANIVKDKVLKQQDLKDEKSKQIYRELDMLI